MMVTAVPLFELDRSTGFDHLTTVYVPPAGPYASYGRLQEIVAHLRAPDGCPWDREQTVQTLRKDLLEEIYELVEALDEDDDIKMAEELGDAALLLTMIAQIGAEEERFQWPQVMTQIVEKLIRRHPHVFGDVEVASVDEVLSNWAAIKDVERGVESGERPVSPFDSVPRALPALMLAGKYQSRLARAGLEPSLDGANPLGRQLWDLVTEAKAGGMDAETALREVCEQVAAHVDALAVTDGSGMTVSRKAPANRRSFSCASNLSIQQIIGTVVVRVGTKVDAAVCQRVVYGVMARDREQTIGNQLTGLPGLECMTGGKDDFSHRLDRPAAIGVLAGASGILGDMGNIA